MTLENEAWMAANPAPGFAKHPDHVVKCDTFRGEVIIEVDGVEVARSTSAILVEESNHKPVFYIPPQDVSADILVDSTHFTRCPFKGKARYWNLKIEDHEIDNAVWSYETPYDEVLELAGMMAFYDTKTNITTN